VGHAGAADHQWNWDNFEPALFSAKTRLVLHDVPGIETIFFQLVDESLHGSS
jgi:hypothetical protein